MIRRLLATALAATALPLTLAAAPAQAALPSESTWLSDVSVAMNGSKTYVSQRAQDGGTRLAVNFDIDNTSLASHYDFGAPVGRVLNFANFARGKGVVLLFNTGRVRGDGRLIRARKQLVAAGYVVTEVCGRNSSSESLAHSKQRCRAHFVDEGYTVIANVGNRSTDFVGGNYERAFRLPNYSNELA